MKMVDSRADMTEAKLAVDLVVNSAPIQVGQKADHLAD
jgi:hypothetical protein